MNNYRNIACVFGKKISSFNHNSLDFVAVLFYYVYEFEDLFLASRLKYF